MAILFSLEIHIIILHVKVDLSQSYYRMILKVFGHYKNQIKLILRLKRSIFYPEKREHCRKTAKRRSGATISEKPQKQKKGFACLRGAIGLRYMKAFYYEGVCYKEGIGIYQSDERAFERF